MSSLRDALLPFTIENATRLPFYREFWANAEAESVSKVRDLPRLPTLSKAQYRQSLMCDEDVVRLTEYISHSSGTTGELTWRHRSAAEATIIGELFGRAGDDAPTDLALAMRYNRHGMAMPVPGRTRSIPIGLDDNDELKQCLRMLDASYRFAGANLRPTLLTGSGHDVALLIQAWLETHTPGQPAGEVHTLHVMGFVDAALRRFLRSASGGLHLVEKYSLSEIFGGASRVWPASTFVLEPHVVGEVVDEDGAHVPHGAVGELVLTELFPFVQMQPLIRYRTGDVVLLVDSGDDRLEFEWLGRRHQCVLDRSTQTWIFGYRPVADWLSLQPVVARETHRPGLSLVRSGNVGAPCVYVRGSEDGTTVHIDVGLSVNPWWDKPNVQGLVNGLWPAMRSMRAAAGDRIRVQLSLRHVAARVSEPEEWLNGPVLQIPPVMLADPAPILP